MTADLFLSDLNESQQAWIICMWRKRNQDSLIAAAKAGKSVKVGMLDSANAEVVD